MVGMFEGGYNHMIKNALYFGGIPSRAFRALFPQPPYEVPNDVFFELTGVAQFILALFSAVALARITRGRSA